MQRFRTPKELQKDVDGGPVISVCTDNRMLRPVAAFQGLGLTYSAEGIRLARLTAPQRRILRVLDTVPPWPELSAA